MNPIIDLKNISKAYNNRIASLRSALLGSKKLLHDGEYATQECKSHFLFWRSYRYNR